MKNKTGVTEVVLLNKGQGILWIRENSQYSRTDTARVTDITVKKRSLFELE